MIAFAAGAQNSKPPTTNLNDVGSSTNSKFCFDRSHNDLILCLNSKNITSPHSQDEPLRICPTQTHIKFRDLAARSPPRAFTALRDALPAP